MLCRLVMIGIQVLPPRGCDLRLVKLVKFVPKLPHTFEERVILLIYGRDVVLIVAQ